MTLPGLALILGCTSLVAGLVFGSAFAVLAGVIVVPVALYVGRA